MNIFTNLNLSVLKTLFSEINLLYLVRLYFENISLSFYI